LGEEEVHGLRGMLWLSGFSAIPATVLLSQEKEYGTLVAALFPAWGLRNKRFSMPVRSLGGNEGCFALIHGGCFFESYSGKLTFDWEALDKGKRYKLLGAGER